MGIWADEAGDAGGGASSVWHRRAFVLEGWNGGDDVEECGQKRREGQRRRRYHSRSGINLHNCGGAQPWPRELPASSQQAGLKSHRHITRGVTVEPRGYDEAERR